jgi:hypothetical protein
VASFVVTDGDLFDKQTKIEETWVSGRRFEHAAGQGRNVEGHYQLQIQRVAQFPGQLFLEITETDNKLEGRVSRKPVPKQAKERKQTDDGSSEPDADANAGEGNASAGAKDQRGQSDSKRSEPADTET